MSQIKAVVLDIGEVLLRLDFRRIFQTLELGEDVRVSTAMDKLNRWALYDTFERGKISPRDFHHQVCDSLANAVSFDDFVCAWNSVIVHEIPGIRELLERVTVPLYALSNSNTLHITHCLAQYSWFSLFRHVYSSHDLGLRKPEVEIYAKVSELVKVPPAGLLFVDDREENVIGARQAGLHAEICVNSPDDLARILSDFSALKS